MILQLDSQTMNALLNRWKLRLKQWDSDIARAEADKSTDCVELWMGQREVLRECLRELRAELRDQKRGGA
jgi:hypothetical protein